MRSNDNIIVYHYYCRRPSGKIDARQRAKTLRSFRVSRGGCDVGRGGCNRRGPRARNKDARVYYRKIIGRRLQYYIIYNRGGKSAATVVANALFSGHATNSWLAARRVPIHTHTHSYNMYKCVYLHMETSQLCTMNHRH